MRFIYPIDYTDYVEEFSSKNNLDEYLVYSVIKCESSFKPEAVSSIGAKGLMQMTPDTFDWVRTKYKDDDELTSDDLFNPKVSIEYGTYLLKMHIEEFGSEKTALAAYHAGRTAVKDWLSNPEYSSDGKNLDKIPYEDTSDYVNRVLNTKETYIKIYGGTENE
ncbi:MAG: lytic transglycosylase domain-containing protein [Clostridia bacterium]|nr:lytic transglycosylase domain-containing protein [Clostridia bacterium]